jgi:flagellar biosynthesis chaperone FliJ
VPPGSKAKVEKSGDVLVPPGKMKVTGFGEDGVAEAEITEQVSAIEYMKKAEEKLAKSIEKTTDERVKKLLSGSSEKYKKSRRDLMISSGNYSSSGMSRATLDKAEEIINSASQMGYALFNDKNVYINGNKISVDEYYDTFLKSIRASIKQIKEEASKEMFPEDKELNRFLKSNSEDEIYKILLKIAGSVFNKRQNCKY